MAFAPPPEHALNSPTQESAWELPEGATVIPAQQDAAGSGEAEPGVGAADGSAEEAEVRMNPATMASLEGFKSRAQVSRRAIYTFMVLSRCIAQILGRGLCIVHSH